VHYGNKDYLFSACPDLRNGQWTHVATVVDLDINKISLYVNGAFIQSLDYVVCEVAVEKTIVYLGGINSYSSSLPFIGRIHSFTAFSVSRTAAEIVYDMNHIPVYPGGADLIYSIEINLSAYPAREKYYYVSKECFDVSVESFEAWIKLSATLNDAVTGGALYSNFVDDGAYESVAPGYISYDVSTHGQLTLYYNTNSFVHTFENYDLRTGDWVHLAVVHDENEFRYYINGELNETAVSAAEGSPSNVPYAVGGITVWILFPLNPSAERYVR
jgi:hypothetical protein